MQHERKHYHRPAQSSSARSSLAAILFPRSVSPILRRNDLQFRGKSRHLKLLVLDSQSRQHNQECRPVPPSLAPVPAFPPVLPAPESPAASAPETKSPRSRQAPHLTIPVQSACSPNHAPSEPKYPHLHDPSPSPTASALISQPHLTPALLPRQASQPRCPRPYV